MKARTRRRILLLAFTLLVLTAIASQGGLVRGVAATSPSPSPSWNTVQNGDFDQGTHMQGIWTCPNAYTAAEEVSGYGGVCTVQALESHNPAEASEDRNCWELKGYPYTFGSGVNWYKFIMYQSVNVPVNQLTVFSASINVAELWKETSDARGCAAVYVVFAGYKPGESAHDIGIIEYYVSSDNLGSIPTTSPLTHKDIWCSSTLGKYVGLGNTFQSGASLWWDFGAQFEQAANYQSLWVREVGFFIYARTGWSGTMTNCRVDAYFDAIRLGTYPTVTNLAASPTEVDGGQLVAFTWSCDAPYCRNMYGDAVQLFDAPSGFKVSVLGTPSPSSTTVDGGSGSSSFAPFSGYNDVKGWYATQVEVTPSVIPYSPVPHLPPPASGPELLNGYTLNVQTNWGSGSEGSATLYCTQRGVSKAYLIASGTTTPASVIVDANTGASISQEAFDNGQRRTIAYDAFSLSNIQSDPAMQTVDYIAQRYVTVNANNEVGSQLGHSVTVGYSGDLAGSHVSSYAVAFTNSWSEWVDYGSILQVSKLTTDSSLQDCWYTYNGTLGGDWKTVISSVTDYVPNYDAVYFHQFRPELHLVSSSYTKVYDNAFHLTTGDTIYACAWLSGADRDARPDGSGTFTFKFYDPAWNLLKTPETTSSCTSGYYTILSTYGTCHLTVTWNDTSGVPFNKTVDFYVYNYSVAISSVVQSRSNLDLTVSTALTGGTTPNWYYLVAVTGGTGADTYAQTVNYDFTYAGKTIRVTTVSTDFFWSGSSWVWGVHFTNFDSLSPYKVAVRIIVKDPITGYVYMDYNTSHADLPNDGGVDVTVPFSPADSWYRHGVFRVYYQFLYFNAGDVCLGSSPLQDYEDSCPLSWIMRDSGVGAIKAVYYLAGFHDSSILIQIPVSLLSSSTTDCFYLAFEDSYAISTQSQINPLVITNTVNNVDAQSNKFEAGGTLSLNLTVTTTHFNAQWVNMTIMVASKNAILVDGNGLTWSNVRIQMQENTALITVPLPEDIGNGTLTLILTPYGNVEPTTTQIVLASSATPPQQGGGGAGGGAGANLAPAIVVMGTAFGIVLAASVSIRAMTRRMRRRGDRDVPIKGKSEITEGDITEGVAPTASMVMRRGSRVAELQLLSLVKAVALMEFDVDKGVQLRVLQDGDSRFIRFLKRDVTRCGDYFDTAAKSYPGTLSITKWGDHITLIPYSRRGVSGRGRRMKSILILSTTKELQNGEVEELKKSMLCARNSSPTSSTLRT